MNTREMPESISLNGKVLSLLTQFPVNDHFQIGIYQGTLSQFDMLVRYKQLINGEYSIKFLILLAKLLMIQEKTNYHEAYMFKNLLEQLKTHQDLYKIISTATHR